jgi:hypothetical protein
LIPDGTFSESDNGDVGNFSDIIEIDSEAEDDETEADIQRLVEQGFEACRLERSSGNHVSTTSAQLSELPMPLRRCGQNDLKDISQDEYDQSGGSHDRRCALREPDTHAGQRCDGSGDGSSPIQPDARLRYLEQSIGAAKIALLQEMGVLDSVLDILPDSALVMTTEEDPSVMSLEDFLSRPTYCSPLTAAAATTS